MLRLVLIIVMLMIESVVIWLMVLVVYSDMSSVLIILVLGDSR